MSRWIVQTNLIAKTVIALLFFGTQVFASPFFGSAGSNTPSAPLQSASSPHILSPNEFSSKVNTLSQSVNASLAQQASVALPKKNTMQGANMSTNPTTSTNTNTTTAAAPTQQPPTSTQPPPLQNTASSLPSPNTTLSAEGNETTAAPAASPTYSGFGTSNNNNPTPHPAQGGSTGGGNGWSVQY